MKNQRKKSFRKFVIHPPTPGQELFEIGMRALKDQERSILRGIEDLENRREWVRMVREFLEGKKSLITALFPAPSRVPFPFERVPFGIPHPKMIPMLTRKKK